MNCPYCDQRYGDLIHCSYTGKTVPLKDESKRGALLNNIVQDLSGDEKFLELVDEIIEKYFGDMTFRAGSETAPFITVKEKDKSGRWCSNVDFYRGHTIRHPGGAIYQNINFYVADFPEGTLGKTTHPDDDETPTVIQLARKIAYNPTVFAHELIHYYEHPYASMSPEWREMLLVSLYAKVSPQVPNCHDIIAACMNYHFQKQVNDVGGVHTPLFLLKSFDIDLKMGKPLGTVFGYGRVNDLKKCIAHFKAQAKHK